MTTEPLDRARAALWRQDGRPLSASEDAREWLELNPLCLLLPRSQGPEESKNLSTPAPSFLEACLGRVVAASTPEGTPEEINRAQALLDPLISNGSPVMLNLSGPTQNQPDFLVHAEVLPWVIALIGDRDWKQPPQAAGNRQVSQLALDAWKLLDESGPVTVAAAREKLGGDLTEAAVLHALKELWRMLRVLPDGMRVDSARWELTQHHHRQALIAGCAISQVTAVSLLVSTYLQSVCAAAEEEIEEFLSPLAARSRIREAVRGLAATGQIAMHIFGTRSLYLLEDSLGRIEPELREEARPQASPESVEERARAGDEQPRRAGIVAESEHPGPEREKRRRPKPQQKYQPDRRPKPRRKQAQSGWRKFSDEPEQERRGQPGKGWDRPKRSFQSPQSPRGQSPQRAEENEKTSEQQWRGGKDEKSGGFRSRRFARPPFQGKQGEYRRRDKNRGWKFSERRQQRDPREDRSAGAFNPTAKPPNKPQNRSQDKPWFRDKDRRRFGGPSRPDRRPDHGRGHDRRDQSGGGPPAFPANRGKQDQWGKRDTPWRNGEGGYRKKPGRRFGMKPGFSPGKGAAKSPFHQKGRKPRREDSGEAGRE